MPRHFESRTGRYWKHPAKTEGWNAMTGNGTFDDVLEAWEDYVCNVKGEVHGKPEKAILGAVYDVFVRRIVREEIKLALDSARVSRWNEPRT
jgi:hypothetical protein